ncbi:hypothetical protein, conserved [Eimeria praecox]|uniref:SET domain-containing protein n=1 Tax=Eimeria praecox TaxID=51316 RepID=U6GRW0_9EIME|nr:hypothetical protein, conserved [Eimeria praecox]
MTEVHSDSDDECICLGADEGPQGPPRPLRSRQGVFTRPQMMAFPASVGMGDICNAEETEDIVVEFDNTCMQLETGPPGAPILGGCGSPAATAKRRALENLERQRAQQTETQNSFISPKTVGTPKRPDSRSVQKTSCILRPEEKVLDVRRLDFGQQLTTRNRGRPTLAVREAPRGQLPAVGEEALWGGAFRDMPAWLPLPDQSVNAQGQKVEWLRHAVYGVGTFLDVERTHEYVECVKALGRERRLKAYGRHEDLREKFQRKPDGDSIPWCKGLERPAGAGGTEAYKPMHHQSYHITEGAGEEGGRGGGQIIRCMEGRQNFIAVEKCGPTHNVQLAEEEHHERVGLENQTAPQHFRAVASLGGYDALPAATILGPPYGGVMRPAGELALMQIIHDHSRNLQGPPRQSYAFRIDNLGCIGEWEAQADKEEVRRGLENDVDFEDPENSVSGEGVEEAWDARTKPLASLDEIHNYVQRTMNRLASCRTFEEATQIERDFCMKDPDIRMDGGSSTEPDYPELDAMDYRSEYSMMNDAHGSTCVGDVNNCHSLMVVIAGLPFFFPVTNRPVRNGEELLLSYGPHYWTGNQSPESLLSATFLQMKAMLNLSFQNKRDEIGRAADVRDGTARLDKSLADERAAEDVVQLLERLDLCDDLSDQRMKAREWVEELRDKLHQEGRGQAVLGALESTVKSLSRGDDLAETFSKLKTTIERVSMDYKKRTLELQEQIKRSEEARKQAEDRNAQLQRHIMTLNDSSQHQASRVARMEVELRRMHAISLRHFVEKERVASARSLQSDDCPYAKVTELLGIPGLPVHATGGDFQRHEEVCKAKRFLVKMELLDRHTSRCGQCGQPYVKGPLAPHGDQQHFWHCRAESHDVAELVEEGEKLAQGQGFLLQKCLNLLSRDSEVCWFLFELLCCLAKTFARLRPKHYARRRQWSLCWEEAAREVYLSRRKEQRGTRRPQEDRRTVQPQSHQLIAVKEDELEDGELRPSEISSGVMVGVMDLPRMAADGTLNISKAHVHAQEHRAEVCSASRAERCTLTPAEGAGDLTGRQEGSGEPPEGPGTSDSACVSVANSCSHLGGRCDTEDSHNHETHWGRRVCVCGGRDNWERAVKRFRCEGGSVPVIGSSCNAGAQGKAAGGEPSVKTEASIDIDALILEGFEDGAISSNTESETTPTMWISRFFRAVEGAHKALAAIEEQRRAVDVAALERDLARRRFLLRQVEALRDRRAAAALLAAQTGTPPSERELQMETQEECEFWKEIYSLSEAVMNQVSLHLNAWGQQLAYFIDTRYMRLEQYERVEMSKDERLRASHRSMHDPPEVERYMTREQKALALRDRYREMRPNYLRYFTFRSRVGVFDDCVSRIKYFAGLEGGNMPSAVNRTLSIISQYADVRPSTWERDVKGVQRPDVEALMQEITNTEEADRLLGKPLFEATKRANAQLAEAKKKLEASEQEADCLRQQLHDLQGELQRLQQAGRTPDQQQPPVQQLHAQLMQELLPQRTPQEAQQMLPQGCTGTEMEAPVPVQRVKGELGGCRAAASSPLLQLYCDSRSAHTVLQRGDFPRIPKEVRDANSGGPGDTVCRFLLPPTPFIFEPPIDVNQSGCLTGFLPAGRTDHFTLDVVLRLPVLSSYGFRMVPLHSTGGNRGAGGLNTDGVERVDLGIGTGPPSSAPHGVGDAPLPPVEQFFSFFRRDVSETAPAKVTLKCQKEMPVGSSREGQRQLPAMRVFPFINGEPVEPLTVPRMPDFFKICSIRGMPSTARRNSLIQVAEDAVELLYVRVFSCDFDPEELPAPPDPRLLLPGQRYASSSSQDAVLCEPSGDGLPQDSRSTSGAFMDTSQHADTPRQEGRTGPDCAWTPNSPAANPDSRSGARDLLSIPPARVVVCLDQRRQHQLMLESLLRDPGNGGTSSSQRGFQQQSQTAGGQPSPSSGEGMSVSRHLEGALQQQQNRLSRAPERFTHNAVVPPFILRKKGTRQTPGPAVSDETQQVGGRSLPHQEAESQTRTDGGFCGQVKGEQTTE